MLTRESFIPTGADRIERPGANAVVYVQGAVAVGFRGRANRPAFNYSFRTLERRDAYVAEFLDRQAANDKAKQERRAAERAARATFQTSLKVGDLLSYSWGYDQTNVEFFQVVKVYPSGKMVDIRPIKGAFRETGFMSGQCQPIADAFIEGRPAIRKRVEAGYGGGDVLSMDFGVCRKVKGEQYYSYYA